MKKFLKMCATFSLVGALFVGCIDNTEPPGVLAMRNQKADLLAAKAEHERALVLVEKAEAELRYSMARVNDAEAKRRLAEAALTDQITESHRITNEVNRATIQKQIEYQVAQYNALIQAELAALEANRALTVENHYNYLQALIDLQHNLTGAKIDEVGHIIDDIKQLLVDRADAVNELNEWKARRVMYTSAEVPKIKALLAYELEQAQWYYEYSQNIMSVWDNLKNLVYTQSLDALAVMKEEMEKSYAKATELAIKVKSEEFNLVALEKDRDAAMYEYKYGHLVNPETQTTVPNVFTSVADDIFRRATVDVDQGLITVPAKQIVTGVVNNVYSFYDVKTPFGSKALLGAKNALEQLVLDSIAIDRNRIIKGVEGWAHTNEQLEDREYFYTNNRANAVTQLTNWRTNYKTVTSTGWAAEGTAYTAALTAYKNFYGVQFTNYVSATNAIRTGTIGDLSGDNAIAATHIAAFAAAILIEDADARNAALAQVPVNCLYFMQTSAILDCLDKINEVITRDFKDGWTIYNNNPQTWVLGGITFNPGKLVELVWGKTNLDRFTNLMNVIKSSLGALDRAEIVNRIMPGFYASAKNYLGEANYHDGPVMQKYNVNNAVEYLAWFALYGLFQQNKIVLGDNVLVVGSGYPNAVSQIINDFMGISNFKFDPAQNPMASNSLFRRANAFPGTYLGAPYQQFTSVPYQASNYGASGGTVQKMAVRNSDRFSIVGLDAHMFGPNATMAAPSVNNINAAAFNLIAKENDLRIKWWDWGNALRVLQNADRLLYKPYFRSWNVRIGSYTGYNATYFTAWNLGRATMQTQTLNSSGNGLTSITYNNSDVSDSAKVCNTPPWIAQRSTAIAVNDWTAYNSATNANPDAFYFLPEETTQSPYPNVDGFDQLYWSNPGMAFKYEDTHSILNGLLTDADGNYLGSYLYYPLIMLKYGTVTGIDWNRFINIGWPNYQGDLVMTEWNNSGLGWADKYYHSQFPALNTSDVINQRTYEGNAGYIPKAFIGKRNYEQYKFWVDQNKEGKYQDLLDNITALIAELRPVVEGLYQDWLAAEQLVVYKEYEIRALKNQSNTFFNHYWGLEGIYRSMLHDGPIDGPNWDVAKFEAAYKARLDDYLLAEAALAIAKENVDVFNSLGIHTLYVFEDNEAALVFVRDRLKVIDANIEALQREIQKIDIQIGLLEAEKNYILDKVISNYK